MYSLVITIAIEVNRAVEEVNTIPRLGFSNDIVEVVIADPEPDKISVINNNASFLFKLSYFFL